VSVIRGRLNKPLHLVNGQMLARPKHAVLASLRSEGTFHKWRRVRK
jgi:hypothetical protein